MTGKVEEDRVEEEGPLRSGHDIPARNRKRGKMARLVGRMLGTQENNQHQEEKKTGGKHSRAFISSADRERRAQTAREAARGSGGGGRRCSEAQEGPL